MNAWQAMKASACVTVLALVVACGGEQPTARPRAPSQAVSATPGPSFAPLPPHERLYSPDSPFNQPIPANPEIDPASAAMVTRLARVDPSKNFPLAVGEWTLPIYEAGPATPVQRVRIINEWEARWDMWMPIPADAAPDPEGDGHLTVIDRTAGCEYDLWRAARTSSGWTAGMGNATSIRGSGIYPYGMSARGSGFASAAGVVWPQELAAGRIDHALMFSYPSPKSGGPVAPATESDGSVNARDAIPEGARLQLDPDLDLDAMGLAPYEKTIARAMQEYGMYLGDIGGTVTLFAVNAQSFPVDAYAGLLPDGPYAYINPDLLKHMRVLRLGPQQPDRPLKRIPEPGCEITRR